MPGSSFFNVLTGLRRHDELIRDYVPRERYNASNPAIIN
jgi:hypothetical protein